MEEVLEVYHRPADSQRPFIYLDEVTACRCWQRCVSRCPCGPALRRRWTATINAKGRVLLHAAAPLLGCCHVEVTGARTKTDYAQVLKTLAEKFPQALRPAVHYHHAKVKLKRLYPTF